MSMCVCAYLCIVLKSLYVFACCVCECVCVYVCVCLCVCICLCIWVCVFVFCIRMSMCVCVWCAWLCVSDFDAKVSVSKTSLQNLQIRFFYCACLQLLGFLSFCLKAKICFESSRKRERERQTYRERLIDVDGER